MRKLLFLLVFGMVMVFGLAQAQAVSFGFNCITNNNAGDCAIGEAQLFVDVTDAGAGKVSFTFSNNGPAASSITDIYFDDGTLLGMASIINGAGVDFSQGASPGDLPGGNNINPPFVTTAGFSADSNPPAQPNGVNPGENVEIIFNLLNGESFDTTLAAIADTSLRIGIHVQGFVTGGSESFVNTPIPGSLLLLGTGILGLVGIRRKLS